MGAVELGQGLHEVELLLCAVDAEILWSLPRQEREQGGCVGVHLARAFICMHACTVAMGAWCGREMCMTGAS